MKILNIENEGHLFYLHYVILPRINKALDLFAGAWNNHGLSSMQNLTPIQLWITDLAQN